MSNYAAFLLSLAAVSLSGCGRAPDIASEDSRPNIVIVVADDIGWADVGFHDSDVISPNLDRLAEEGVELTSFYVYPTCSPTRTALMTGRPPSRFGIRGPLQYNDDRGLPPGTPTLASHFAEAGYDTAISGKWHLGMNPNFGPNHYGFRHAYGYVGPWIDSYTHLVTDWQNAGDPIRHWHRNGTLIDETGHVTDLITNEAVDFLTTTRDKSKPFLLYVPYSAPHAPAQEPGEWLDLYGDSIDNVSRRYFAAAVSHMDDGIGRIRETLRAEGLEQNTIFLFFSDNGGQQGGDHTRWLRPPRNWYMAYGPTDVLGNNLPLRGWKGQLYEGGIRVPAAIYWPGRLESGANSTTLLVTDWMPTLSAAAGVTVPVPESVEGVDMWGALNGSPAPERILYWADQRSQAVRDGDWKLVRREGDELFNLADDPYETADLSAEEPEVRDRLSAELERNLGMDAPMAQ